MGVSATVQDTCFVVMPFGEPHDTRYRDVYGPAIEDAGLRAVRGDDSYTSSSVMQQVWEGIKGARLIVADLSARNPNVLYELGLAHSAYKPTILVASDLDDVPFDLRSMRVILVGGATADEKKRLRDELARAIRESLGLPLDRLLPVYLSVSPRHEQNVGRAAWDDPVALRAEIDALRVEIGEPNDAPRKTYSRRAAESAWFEGVFRQHKSIEGMAAELLGSGVPKAWVRARKLLYRIPGFDEES